MQFVFYNFFEGSMYKAIFAIFAVSLLLTRLDAEASAGTKNYVMSDQIDVNPEGIFIFFEHECLKVNGIFQDKEGFYYIEEGVMWICGNCGALNSLDDAYCYNCKKPY